MTEALATQLSHSLSGRFPSIHPCPSVASQTCQQPRISPLRAVVADGYAKSLLLPDQHEQPLPTCYARVDQVALDQHVVLRGERDHHCRETPIPATCGSSSRKHPKSR